MPAGVTQAQLRLPLPPGAVIELEHVESRQPSDTETPVAFRAQSPGELAVSGAEVVYDVVPAPAPAFPPTGACTPTAPGHVPGAEPDPHGCCCADHERHDTKPMIAGAPSRVNARGTAPLRARVAAPHSLTEVGGIGPIRARRLARVGITTAERLAVADPRLVARVAGSRGKPATRTAAQSMIACARELSLTTNT